MQHGSAAQAQAQAQAQPTQRQQLTLNALPSGPANSCQSRDRRHGVIGGNTEQCRQPCCFTTVPDWVQTSAGRYFGQHHLARDDVCAYMDTEKGMMIYVRTGCQCVSVMPCKSAFARKSDRKRKKGILGREPGIWGTNIRYAD